MSIKHENADRIVRCNMCGDETDFGSIDVNIINYHLEAHGWEVERKTDTHCCPACVEKREQRATPRLDSTMCHGRA